MQERRGYVRFDVQGQAVIKCAEEPGGAQGEWTDISYGGFAMTTQDAFSSEEAVSFELTTDLLDEPLAGKGKIKNVNKVNRPGSAIFRVGIEFVDIDRRILLNLMEMVDARRRAARNRPGL